MARLGCVVLSTMSCIVCCFLTQTLPSIVREEEQAHSSATSKVLWDAGDASLGLLLEFQATRYLLLQLYPESCVRP